MEKLDGKTFNVINDNIEKLKEIFPEVITEEKIDFEKLQQALGENIEKSKERYDFTWNGKSEAINMAQKQTTGTLRPCKEESVNWDTTQNLYIEGDNLEVLRVLQNSYRNKVKMIYIDPPYNTGNDFIYEDDFKNNVKNYLEMNFENLKSNAETSGRYHTDWLNLMYPRLKIARNLLKDDGVIFMSIDDVEVNNLKKISDEIFGESNFISIITREAIKGGSQSRHIRVTHDYILIYCKDINSVNLTGIETEGIKLNLEDEKGKYAKGRELNKWGAGSRREDSPSMWFPIPGPNGEEVYPIRNDGSEGRWRLGKAKMQKLVEENDVLFEKRDNGTYIAYQKIRDDSPKIKQFTTLFTDKYINARGTEEIKSLFEVERTLFDYAKPVELIEDLITMSNLNEHDIVLDFFSGSATTAQACMKKSLEDNKAIKYILVQLDESTGENSEARKLGYSLIPEVAKDRIRKSGNKLLSSVSGNDNKLDIGFKVFKLDETNLHTWDSEKDNLEQNLIELVESLKDGRTQEDVVYEVLLKFGVDLTVPINEKEIADKTVYDVGMGYLFICLEKNLELYVIEEIAKVKPTRVVFYDESFKDDTVRTNAQQILKRYGVEDVRVI
ncbi:site-specific DNA-methyltransferase [Halobacillus sp. Marseille-P3879]|uniref:site-specific DNA-methyltransferase n=1 Tax=Halobacillus sp. Marseille-P3879 TaxID=2045014 RepID=UPI000C7BFE2B|nr:site-specific DNA-methyltransferase [Halobacillus sp. Marseille-P3879]